MPVRNLKGLEAWRLSFAGVSSPLLGAYHRVNNGTGRRALDLLRGGAWARPVTAADPRTLREFGALFSGS